MKCLKAKGECIHTQGNLKNKVSKVIYGDSESMYNRNTPFFCAEKGITLIALVITIIVLLILAGAGISMALNEGGLGKVKEAVESHNREVQNEQETLGYYENMMDEYFNQYLDKNKPIIPLTAKITYSNTDLTSQPVTVVVETNKPLKEAPTGIPSEWTIIDDTHYKREYPMNAIETIVLEDLDGLTTIVTIEIDWIDTTELIGSADRNIKTWTNQNVIVTITTTKPLTELPSGGGWTPTDVTNKVFTKEYLSNTMGVENVIIRDSINAKTVEVVVDNIDKAKPNTFDLSVSKTLNSITLSGSTTDLESGINRYEYKIDSGSWQNNYTFNVETGSSHTVYARAIDNAGNIRDATNSGTIVNLDADLFTIRSTSDKWTLSASGVGVWASPPTVVIANATAGGWTKIAALTPVDVTNYKHIRFTFTMVNDTGTDPATGYVGLGNAADWWNAEIVRMQSLDIWTPPQILSTRTYDIDVSDLSGDYYLGALILKGSSSTNHTWMFISSIVGVR